jgi:hypothetical protein
MNQRADYGSTNCRTHWLSRINDKQKSCHSWSAEQDASRGGKIYSEKDGDTSSQKHAGKHTEKLGPLVFEAT